MQGINRYSGFKMKQDVNKRQILITKFRRLGQKDYGLELLYSKSRDQRLYNRIIIIIIISLETTLTTTIIKQ